MSPGKPDPDCPNCELLRREVAELKARVEALEALVRKLSAKAGQTSRNSSQPPSSDPPWEKPRPRSASGEKRKRGAQPGSEKSERELKPTDEVDAVEVCRPDRCGTCGEDLEGHDPVPRRHQVTEIPPIRPRVTEYRLHRLTCGSCGESTRATLPNGVPRGAFGPRLQATIAVLTGQYRQSRRNTQQILSDVFGVEMSLGAISKLEGQVSELLVRSHRETLAYVRTCEAVHADETSWRESGRKSWLWVATGGKATVFLIRSSRSGAVAKELLGEDFAGTLISDRYSGYKWVDLEKRQLCWAHIIRDFRKIAASGEEARGIGEGLELLAAVLFKSWHQVRDGTLSKSHWEDHAANIRVALKRLLKKGSECGAWRAPGICRGILEEEAALWTFVSTEGVEPTNNEAERAVRPAVIWRKTSLGTQSERGSRYAERMLTCVATLRQRGRSVFGYLHSACEAALFGRPAPSLLS